jgi:hypothetical protein
MNYYTPDQLAYGMRSQAQQMGGSASISLSVVRTALQHSHQHDSAVAVAVAEKRSITKFAHDNGFEYLSLTMRDGKPICNFWRVPDA